MKYRKYDWSVLEEDGCLVFRVPTFIELLRIRDGVYTYVSRTGRRLSCLQVPGILFVVREPDGAATVGAPSQESAPCQADQSATRSKEWRLYVRTGRRPAHRRRRTLRIAPRSEQPRPPPSMQPSSRQAYTVSPSGRLQPLQRP